MSIASATSLFSASTNGLPENYPRLTQPHYNLLQVLGSSSQFLVAVNLHHLKLELLIILIMLVMIRSVLCMIHCL